MNTPHSPVPARPGASAATTPADMKASRPVMAKERPRMPFARSSTYLAAAHPTFRFIVLFALPFALMLSGCATIRRHQEAKKAPPPSTFTPTPVAELPPLDPALLQRPNTEYRLGPGDVLDIEVLGDINTRQRSTVGPDGKIYFYILPGIDVWGMTIPQARDRVVQEMKKFVRDEQPVAITLRAAESQHIWILGRLNRPGVYPLTGSMTLLEAISEAGGPASSSAVAATVAGPTIGLGGGSRGSADEAADLSRAFVVRQGRMLRVDFRKLLRDGDTGQNIYLQPDDLVYLPSAQIGSVHVLGAVNTPRAVDYASNLTLSQAIGEAGGMLMKNAYLSNVAIVRGSLSEPRIAVVDFNAILHGQAPDLALEPQDIVYVPYTPYRVLTRYVDLILDTFVRTVGVNEGAKAISNNIQPLGVTVPLGGR